MGRRYQKRHATTIARGTRATQHVSMPECATRFCLLAALARSLYLRRRDLFESQNAVLGSSAPQAAARAGAAGEADGGGSKLSFGLRAETALCGSCSAGLHTHRPRLIMKISLEPSGLHCPNKSTQEGQHGVGQQAVSATKCSLSSCSHKPFIHAASLLGIPVGSLHSDLPMPFHSC